MKLYYAPGTCSLSPHIVLLETKTPFTAVKTDLKTKKTEDGGDYLKVNPMGYVPALELEDGTVLTEGPAIVQYIADTAGALELAPPMGRVERYKMQSWLGIVSTELHKNFSSLFNPKMPDAATAIAKAQIEGRLAAIDKHLASNSYLMGRAFTLPDAYLFTVLQWAPKFGIEIGSYRNLSAYMGRIRARPAVEAAMRAEGHIT